MKLTTRLVVLLIVLLLVQAVYSGMNWMIKPNGVKLPTTSLGEMPLNFEGWVCAQGGEPDEEAEVKGEAAASMHRIYRDTAQQIPVSVYTALWTQYENRLPHTPQVCYPASGFKILETSEITLKGPNDSTAQACLMHIESKDQDGYLLYWYQLGDQVMWNSNQSQKVVWSFRGSKDWPPLAKVMLDIRGVDEPTAKRLLVDLGQRVLAFTSTEL